MKENVLKDELRGILGFMVTDQTTLWILARGNLKTNALISVI
jgi:hypothetical protein